MRKVKMVTLLGLAALLAAGCSPGTDQTPGAAPATTQGPSLAATASRVLPQPDEAQKSGYLAAVKVIDPRLAEKPDRAVSHGRDICLDLKSSRDKAVRLAAQRDEVTPAVAEKLVAAAIKHLCPSGSY